MVFGCNADPTLHIDEIEIAQVNNTKFLGVHLDSSLDWNIHTSTLINLLVSNRYILQLTRNYMPEKVKQLVYCAHISSHITYTHITWGPICSQWAKDRVYQIQKDCVRLICNKSKISHGDQLFNKLKLLKLSKITEFELLKAYHLLHKKGCPLSVRELFFKSLGKPKHWYPTGNKNIPNMPKHSSMLFNNSFLCNSIIVVQNCHESCRRCSSLEVLKRSYNQLKFTCY